MNEGDASNAMPRSVALAALAVVGATFALTIWVASREWFYGDDFIFLRQAQLPHDWWQVFVPLEPRLWWSYRPLSIEAFFATGVALFGLRAFPFLLFTLVVHFASGILLFRIAIHLGIERRVAFFSGCLFVLMYPTLHEIFWASTFQPVSAIFFYLLSVSCFLAYLEHGQRRWLLASVAAQILVALCNELGVTLPAVLAVLAMARATGGVSHRVGEAIRRTWPHVLLLAAYLIFRFVVLPPGRLTAPALFYQPRFGPHMLRNLGSYAVFLVHESWLHATAVVALLGLGWASVRGAANADARRKLQSRSAAMIAWMFLAMIPFVALWYAQHRMVMVIEAPFCLLIAAHFDAIWSRWGSWRPRVLEWAMVVLLIAAVPYAALWQRGLNPLGDFNYQIVRLMRMHYPEPRRGTCVALRTVSGEGWSPNDLFAVWFVTSGLLSALHPGQNIELRVPNHKSLLEEPSAECVVLEVVSRKEVRFGRPPTSRRGTGAIAPRSRPPS